MTINSIQRGSASLTTTATSGNITISSVDTSKSFVTVTFDNGLYSTETATAYPGNRGIGLAYGYMVSYYARLTSSTNLEIGCGQVSTQGTVRWQVIEYQ